MNYNKQKFIKLKLFPSNILQRKLKNISLFVSIFILILLVSNIATEEIAIRRKLDLKNELDKSYTSNLFQKALNLGKKAKVTLRRLSETIFDQAKSDKNFCFNLRFNNFSSLRTSLKCILLYENENCVGKIGSVINIANNDNVKTASFCTVDSDKANPNTEIDDFTDIPVNESTQKVDDKKQEKDLNEEKSTSLQIENYLNKSTVHHSESNNFDAISSSSQMTIDISSLNHHFQNITRGRENKICKIKCKEQDKVFGEHWEVCAGEIEYHLCPNQQNTNLWASWKCDINGQFTQSTPNYTECKSDWIVDAEQALKSNGGLKSTLGVENVILTVKSKISTSNFKDGSRTSSYFGHEITDILNILSKATLNFSQSNFGASLEEKEKITESTLEIFSTIGRQTVIWDQLPKKQRAVTCNKFIESIESTTFELARSTGNSFSKDGKFIKSLKINSDAFKIRVGSFLKSNIESFTVPGDTRDPIIKLPTGWSKLIKTSNKESSVQFSNVIFNRDFVRNIVSEKSSKNADKEPEANKDVLISKVASFTLGNSQGASKIIFPEKGILITFPHVPTLVTESKKLARRLHSDEEPSGVHGSEKCVYWDTTNLIWSSYGCQVVETSRTYSVCECKHLSSFALLMDVHDYVGKDTGVIVLTRLLSTLSCFFLIVTIILFKKLNSVRNPRSSVTIHLCFMLLMGNILLLTLMDRDNFPLPEGFCAFVGMLAHFVFLSAFVWMGIEGYIVYKMVVDVFESGAENKVRLRLYAYGLPSSVVFIFLFVHVLNDGSTYGGELFCWLQGNYIWSFIGPVIVITVVNIVVLVIALQKAYHKSNSTFQVKQTVTRETKTMIVGALSLTSLLGITWLVGILVTIDNQTVSLIGAYLFTILNASQGICIFIFHCWMNKTIKTALRKRISSWQTNSSSLSTGNESQRPQSALYRKSEVISSSLDK